MDVKTQEFLNHHKITSDDLYDAQGQPVNHVKDDMKKQDKLFAFNTTPCQKGGHTIRDRYSHCIVCAPANISYVRRSRLIGYVYIAGSMSKQVIKVGMSTTKIEDRLSRLNSRKVGNTSDWIMLKAIKCEYANKIEIAVQKSLKKYKLDGDFYDGVESNEIFTCNFKTANTVLEEYFEINDVEKIETRNPIFNTEKYNFRNLLNPKYSN
ncbi:GIY-YIG nuclease family protein [Chryseobacterium balustinum]|uniref:GIY-YIG nuclease family protein n=1 Tax=Chryseobacterium balustinum TaxID=246 RepID=UPI003CF26173